MSYPGGGAAGWGGRSWSRRSRSYESLGFSNRDAHPDGPVNYFYEREL
jgi:hypothetical protein